MGFPWAAFRIQSEYLPAGEQPQAIAKIVEGLDNHRARQVILGVTGSGKTFTMAHIIATTGRPALILSHNKTLAAQLYAEMKSFFPDNAVEYFVSYYDYYQPEAYIAARDIYIEKDSAINQDLDRLRLSATASLLLRRDVVIVASVSSIYGLGSPENALAMMVKLQVGEKVDRRGLLLRLQDIQYKRNDYDFVRGTYRVRGDAIEIFPSASAKTALRLEMFDDVIEEICEIDPLTGAIERRMQTVALYPAKHYVLPEGSINRALKDINSELVERIKELDDQGKLLESHRLKSRTKYDLEMMQEVGFCSGIENYSRHLEGRKPGSRPYTLFDFLPPDALLFVDESHITIPQVRGMFFGDRNRKQNLVDHGFRLPSAMDNRPMSFAEFEEAARQMVCISATPGPWELEQAGGVTAELVVRPTGLVDPPIEIRPTANQIPDILNEVKVRAAKHERVLVNVLTKRMAEDLAQYIKDQGLRGRYLHSDIDAIERVTILRDLRLGNFDVLVGVNLLREGLDLPEVSLVAMLDADKEGFLRSKTSLVQAMGRAARNVEGSVIFYADVVTPAMRDAIAESEHRRTRQLAYNKEHGITPQTIRSEIKKGIELVMQLREEAEQVEAFALNTDSTEKAEILAELERQMLEHAENLEFERAADLRDRIDAIKAGKTSYTPKSRTGGKSNQGRMNRKPLGGAQPDMDTNVIKRKHGKGRRRPPQA
ncbi:MAG TPA: excinuclease ABC subunit UvrB [Planctomycetota bacterium]|nr:excinuclease ABC subunit UvrB [Planctomycetota bacterium]